ncbi:Crp/Fnr family transcriptional regulator [Kineococcus glutinatus]
MPVPALDRLDERTRARLLTGAQRRRFRREEVVFHAGDPAASMHALLSGHVSVSVTTPLGDTVIFAVLGPGALFGELSLLSPDATRSATVTALEPAETLAVSRERLMALRASEPALDRFLLDLVADYVRRQDVRLLEALYVPADKRVLRRLLALVREYGGGAPGTTVPLTQEVLATMAGTTRPTANQVLRSAQEAGLLALERGRLTVLDPAGLARRAR